MSFEAPGEYWNGRYSSIGSSRVSWYEASPDTSLELLDRCGITIEASVIDIGGGASRLVDSLLERGHRDLAVLDLSTEALDEARRRTGAHATSVDWIVGDVREFVPTRRWDVWHDRAAFHFLVDAAGRRRNVEALADGLAAGGLVIVAAFAEDGPEQCSGLPVERYSADRLFGELSAELPLDLLVAERQVHVTPSGSEQPFTWVAARRTHVGPSEVYLRKSDPSRTSTE